jgi:YYY domain-containing protein
MNDAIRWWLVLQVIALAMLPLCLVMFRRLPDRGYALSKPFGLLFLAYLFWFLNSIHVVPNSVGGIVFVLIVLGAISGAFAYVDRDELREWIRGHWQYMLGVEVLLLIVFGLAVWLRSTVGAASVTEQPMDLMFVNAATRASHFPPQDPWLSGHTVSYYYFGYLMVAMTGRFAGVPPEIGYNIGFATTATLALVGASGIVYNLVHMREAAVVESVETMPVEARPPRRPERRARAVAPPRRRKAAARPHLYDVLGIAQESTAQQIEGAYRAIAREYAPDLNPGDRLAEVKLQEAASAYGVLSDPDARRAYDESSRTTDSAPAETTPVTTAQVAASSEDGLNGAGALEAEVVAEQPAPEAEVRADGPAAELSWRNWRPAVFGLTGGLLLVAAGNLVALVQFMSAYGIGSSGFFDWLDIQGVISEPRHTWYPSRFFGFFSASRIYPLDKTDAGRVITEFPMFSFLLGDMHPHVMALPFVLLAVAAALMLFRSEEPLDIAFWLRRPLMLVGVAIIIGGLAFINTWDIATLAFVIVAAAAVSNFLRVRRFTVDLAVQIVSFALPLLILAVAAYIPFYASFTSQANGILAVVSSRSVTVPATRPVHAFLFWAPLFAVVLPFVLARLAAARDRIDQRQIAMAFVPLAAVIVGWLLVFGFEKAGGSGNLNGAGGLGTQISDRGAAWLTDAFIGAALAASLLALWLELTAATERAERRGVIFTLLLSSTALLLVLGTEFFYVGDVFNSRMNTVFKLYYQAWMMLALAGGFSLYYLACRWRFSFPRELTYRQVWAGLAIVSLGAAALYPIGMTFNRTRPYSESGQRQTVTSAGLDALNYLSTDDRNAIHWLDGLAQGQDLVIAEAVGGDYTSAARISGSTGIPAILGWGGHEDQWRGGSSEARAGRFEDVTELYSTDDLNRAKDILQKYSVTYVYVGGLERQTYPAGGIDKFKSLPVAYQGGTVTIYRATTLTGEVASAP